MYDILGSHGYEYEYGYFCDALQCSLVDMDRHFRGSYCLHFWRDERSPDDVGNKFLWNVGQYMPDTAVQYPSRQPYSTACYTNVLEVNVRRILNGSC